jgi:hypothetical protein
MTETTSPTTETPVTRGRGRPPGKYGKYKSRKPKPNLNPPPPQASSSVRLTGIPRTTAARIFSNLAIEARKYAHVALDQLVYLVTNGETHSIQLGASVAILDRGYGRPTQTLDLRADIHSTSVNVIAELKPDDRRIMHEAMKAIEHNPAAAALVAEGLQDDEPIDAIPDDVLDLKAEPA